MTFQALIYGVIAPNCQARRRRRNSTNYNWLGSATVADPL